MRYNVLTHLLLGAMVGEKRTLIRRCGVYIVILFWMDPEITNRIPAILLKTMFPHFHPKSSMHIYITVSNSKCTKVTFRMQVYLSICSK